MNDEYYNTDMDESTADQVLQDYYLKIRDSDICDTLDGGGSPPNLYDAMREALEQFDEGPLVTNDLEKDKKICECS